MADGSTATRKTLVGTAAAPSIGEGVASLRQAFHIAGAASVIASLWQVPDQETAQLMTEFYELRSKGHDDISALREAQLRLIRQHRKDHGSAHPYYWAAFLQSSK